MTNLLKLFGRALRRKPRDCWERLRNQLPPGALDALLDAGVAVYQVLDDDKSVDPNDRGKWFISTYSRFCDVEGDFSYASTELEAWQQAFKIFGPHLH
ncbi:TPA: hypothetical protein ACYLN4_000714 [Burkholderia lata]